MGPILLDILIFLKRETRYNFLIQFVFPYHLKWIYSILAL